LKGKPNLRIVREGWKPSDDYSGETIQQLMKLEKYFGQSSPPPGKNPGYALG